MQMNPSSRECARQDSIFFRFPSTTKVPDHILRAMDRPTIDHRSREFAALGRRVLEGASVDAAAIEARAKCSSSNTA
jgi:hypothetical protein